MNEPKQVPNKRDARGRLLPGSTANPNGRPSKGYSISDMMREMLNNKPDVKESLGSVILAKALEGDIQAIKLVWNYMDGMPAQGLELTGKDGGPISVSSVDQAIAAIEQRLS